MSIIRKSTFYAMVLCAISPAHANPPEVSKLRGEIQTMRNMILQLEEKLKNIENNSPEITKPSTGKAKNIFSPSVEVILNGQLSGFSAKEGEIAGFAVGHEGERGREGFAIDETELNFSADIDDKFRGNLTTAIAQHEGTTEIELEEAYVQTLSGLGLPEGFDIKFGRAFWTLGSLNAQHTHEDDFVDRPLPYRAFLNGTFNDDGAEFTYKLPTDFYAKVGGGLFRGDDFPFGEADGEGISAWSAFARIGNNINDNHKWRLGGYVLSGEATAARSSNEDIVNFVGDTDLYGVDFQYSWFPTGNANNQEVTFTGEYFWRDENGTYEDTDAATGEIPFDETSSGWYVQSTYKFHPQWRVGARYSMLNSADTPSGLTGSALDAGGYDPQAFAFMTDWTPSPNSKLRFQYNYEELSRGNEDNQFILQYIMRLGSGGEHNHDH